MGHSADAVSLGCSVTIVPVDEGAFRARVFPCLLLLLRQEVMILLKFREPIHQSRSCPLSGSDLPRRGQLVIPLLRLEVCGVSLLLCHFDWGEVGPGP
jgi:hypothetical protein